MSPAASPKGAGAARPFPADLPLADQLARARTADGALRAFAHLPERLAEPACDGPLSGVAVGVKDIIDTADMPTGYGSAIDPAHVPPADAWVVARLKALGGVVLGKTVSTEFAWREPGPTVNPRNPAHTPGGSSSGSAAAVAAGLTPLAFGTQTVGSVVRPAAFCGVVGFKPSFGAVPRTGVQALAWSLDHVGFMTRTVAQAAAALEMFAAADPSDPASRGVAEAAPADGPVTIAVLEPWGAVSAAQAGARDAAAAALRTAGATIRTLSLPDCYAAAGPACMLVLAVEGRRIHAGRVARWPDRTSAHLKALVESGGAVSVDAYAEALSLQIDLRAGLAAALDGCDALLTVPASGEAPAGLSWTGDPSFCAPWTFIGAPAITVPVTDGPSGLPLGAQLVAPWGRDRSLLKIAAMLEAARGA